MAEPLAICDEDVDGEGKEREVNQMMEMNVCKDHPFWVVAAGADGDATTIPRRSLPPMTLGHWKMRKETLRKCWKSYWEMIMLIRIMVIMTMESA